MKSFWIIWGVILVAVVFQTSFLAPWFSNAFYPDLLLALLAALTIIFGFQRTWGWVAAAGITMDLFSYSKIGAHVIIFILAAYSVSFISRRFQVGGRGAGMILVIILMPAITALDFWGLPLLSGSMAGAKIFTFQSLISLAVITLENAALFYLFYFMINRVKKYYSPVQYRINR